MHLMRTFNSKLSETIKSIYKGLFLGTSKERENIELRMWADWTVQSGAESFLPNVNTIFSISTGNSFIITQKNSQQTQLTLNRRLH